MSVVSDDLVVAMISAATGTEVHTYKDFEKMEKKNENEMSVRPLNLQNLHQILLMSGPVCSSSEDEKQIQVFVITLTGQTLTIECSPMETVENFKSLIRHKCGLGEDQQRLVFAGKPMEDGRTIKFYNIGHESMVHLVPRLRGGAQHIIYLEDSCRSKKFDYDFTNISDNGKNFKRGGCVYKRPLGTKRIALNVLNRFGDHSWLGVVGRTSETSDVPGEWAVSYHGTGKHNLKSIAEDGYLLSKGQRFAFGRGIYSTPDLAVALLYAQQFVLGNETYKFVLQNRVNPNTVKRVSASETGRGEYWISEKQEDVRPYGICIKKC